MGMASKKRSVEKKIPKFELVLEAQIQTTGTHPWFHDLDRLAALRSTAARAKLDPDIARLHGLLQDAHERLEVFERGADESDVESLKEAFLNLESENASLEEEIGDLETTVRNLNTTIEELKEVEPLATAFAILCANGFQLRDADLPPGEKRDAVEKALELLRG